VTEWGVHWNFFCTITIVNFFIVFIKNVKSTLILAVIIMTCYEFALDVLNLKYYIFYAPRVDMFSANREGIFSTFGYASIILIGMSFGS
jgi:phosphatidylinositol glycan class W